MDEIRNLSVKDASIGGEHVSIFIPKRKNDQYTPARSHKSSCPVSITQRLLKLLPPSTESSSPLVYLMSSFVVFLWGGGGGGGEGGRGLKSYMTHPRFPVRFSQRVFREGFFSKFMSCFDKIF